MPGGTAASQMGPARACRACFGHRAGGRSGAATVGLRGCLGDVVWKRTRKLVQSREVGNEFRDCCRQVWAARATASAAAASDHDAMIGAVRSPSHGHGCYTVTMTCRDRDETFRAAWPTWPRPRPGAGVGHCQCHGHGHGTPAVSARH
jgi:hypothetical protein